MRFEGSHSLTLDAKGRLTVPVRVREQFEALCGGALVLTRWLDNCLRLYPLPAWERLRDDIMPTWPMTAAGFAKAVLQTHDAQQIDSAGRILVKDTLRSYARLEKRVVLAADNDVWELWDEERHNRFLDEKMAEGIPAELLSGLKF